MIQKLYKKTLDDTIKYCTVQIFSSKINLPSKRGVTCGPIFSEKTARGPQFLEKSLQGPQ